MRLTQREQIIIQKTAYDNPSPTSSWLLAWVEEARTHSGTFDIGEIPVPSERVQNIDALPLAVPVKDKDKEWKELKKTKEQERDEWKQLLIEIGYDELDRPLRKAIQKFHFAKIDHIEETDRLPDSLTCWLGDHDDMRDDEYLWIVVGTWASDKSLVKWGCKSCAQAIISTHPEGNFG
jgi:hypothetical protein